MRAHRRLALGARSPALARPAPWAPAQAALPSRCATYPTPTRPACSSAPFAHVSITRWSRLLPPSFLPRPRRPYALVKGSTSAGSVATPPRSQHSPAPWPGPDAGWGQISLIKLLCRGSSPGGGGASEQPQAGCRYLRDKGKCTFDTKKSSGWWISLGSILRAGRGLRARASF